MREQNGICGRGCDARGGKEVEGEQKCDGKLQKRTISVSELREEEVKQVHFLPEVWVVFLDISV